jgi:nicotinate-nucleotide pyrophosphorylase (carboxylating)
LNPLALGDALRGFIMEDLDHGDITSQALLPPDLKAEARIISRSPGVLAGCQAAAQVFAMLDPFSHWQGLIHDGEEVEPGQTLAKVNGLAQALLSGERLALNLLQRLSGIATATATAVKAVHGTGLTVLDTRKTTPGLRVLEKEAVKAGGGSNHRFGLYDAVLIKDNHLGLAGGPAEAIALAREKVGPLVKIEVEAENLEQVSQAMEAGADMILLDNMSLEQVRQAVALVAGRCPLEASGNLRVEDLPALAKTGVDFVSLGSITHSAPPLDLSMQIVSTGSRQEAS